MAELNTLSLLNDTNLQYYCRFEGNSIDSKGTNNGVDTAISYGTQYGKYGQGANFNGTTSRVTLSDASPVKPSGNFSIGGWIKKTSANTSRGCVMSNYSENAPNAFAGFFLDCDQNAGELGFVIGFGSSFTRASNVPTNAPTDGKRHHFIGTYDGSNMRIYWDGVLVNTTANTNNAIYSATTYHRIGCNNQTGADNFFFGGDIDELSVWNRALTASEIYSLFVDPGGAFLLTLI